MGGQQADARSLGVINGGIRDVLALVLQWLMQLVGSLAVHGLPQLLEQAQSPLLKEPVIHSS